MITLMIMTTIILMIQIMIILVSVMRGRPEGYPTGVCEINTSRCRLCFQRPDPAPLISKLTPRYPAAADKTSVFISQTNCTHFTHVREH